MMKPNRMTKIKQCNKKMPVQRKNIMNCLDISVLRSDLKEPGGHPVIELG